MTATPDRVLYVAYDMVKTKSKPTYDAVEILHRRLTAGKPERLASVEARLAEREPPDHDNDAFKLKAAWQDRLASCGAG
jgi:hypothetical protein